MFLYERTRGCNLRLLKESNHNLLLIGWLIVQMPFYFLKGTRMWRRGADPDGYVANFVETEQLMQFNGYTASFVQVLLSTFTNHLL
jgi:hypothetical protein